jgi:hypothetical protein
MGSRRKIIGQAVFAGLSLCAAHALAAPREPLVVTKMTDPDPGFFPPPADRSAADRSAAKADEDARLEQAMQDVGRVVGQAAMIEQQQIESRCRTGLAADATAEQRLAWAGSCGYSRH